MKRTFIILTALCLTAVLSGCTTKRVEGSKVPVRRHNTDGGSGKHAVVKGDTLWGIAGSGEAYSDNMLWPLLFKYNRDTVKDPDLIYPGQRLTVQKNVTDEETKKARKAASDTPPYQPHTTPRETLPLDYF